MPGLCALATALALERGSVVFLDQARIGAARSARSSLAVVIIFSFGVSVHAAIDQMLIA